MWKKLKRSRNGIYEIWLTYGKYLVCNKYKHQFKYFKTYLEALTFFEEIDT